MCDLSDNSFRSLNERVVPLQQAPLSMDTHMLLRFHQPLPELLQLRLLRRRASPLDHIAEPFETRTHHQIIAYFLAEEDQPQCCRGINAIMSANPAHVLAPFLLLAASQPFRDARNNPGGFQNDPGVAPAA